MELNTTWKVASLFSCATVNNDSVLYHQNALWKQTMLGCAILQLIQEVYNFNVSFVYQQMDPARDVTTEVKMYLNSSGVDFYLRPMSLRVDVLELAIPIVSIFDWNFGFTISPVFSYMDFYSKPFTRRVWNFLSGMALFCSIFFYLLKKWENKIKRSGRTWECSYGYELLMVVGAYCQHIPPIEARLLSRRTAYFVFFIFTYIVYTYYTSNLLSHLVNDKNNGITLEQLLSSDIDPVILENVKPILNNNIVSIYSGVNLSAPYQKLLKLRSVSIEEGLRSVKTTKTALLSDYDTIAPYIRTVFNNNEICSLEQIDVVSRIKKYLFVSKTFPYTEQLKVRNLVRAQNVSRQVKPEMASHDTRAVRALIPMTENIASILRVKETGLLSRLVQRHFEATETFECTPLPHVQTQFLQIVYPLSVLVGAYVLCVFILAVETFYSRRYRVWPYIN